MKLRKTFAGLGVAGVLAGGCTSSEKPATPSPEALPSAVQPLTFQRNPDTNYSIVRCDELSHTWAVRIDSDPRSAPTNSPTDDPFTLGAPGRKGGEYPNLISGATVRKVGSTLYQIATSEHAPGTSTEVNLQQGGYARVLGATASYDLVFSAHLGKDKRAYFTMNCLPSFDHIGSLERSVPLEDIPTVPPVPSAPTQPTHPSDI